jgi:hypothetical protein
VGDNGHIVLGQKFPGEKESKTVHCRDAATNSIAAEVWGEVFSCSRRKMSHNSMQNWLFGLPG